MTDTISNAKADCSVPGQVTVTWSATVDEYCVGFRLTANEKGTWVPIAQILDPKVRSITAKAPAGTGPFHLMPIAKASPLVELAGTILEEKHEETQKEKEEREARERAEREAREKAEREAREKAEREAREKAEREQREKEEKEKEPPKEEGAVVNHAPTGPPVPSGGWTVAFADGFAKLSTSVWNIQNRQGHNSNELEIFKPEQCKIGPKGLELDVTYSPNCGTSYGSSKNYAGGEVQSNFTWQPAQGNTFCIEWVGQIPNNITNGQSNGMDPACWSTDKPWTRELDHPEWWGWGHTEYYAGWVWVKGGGSHESFHMKTEVPNPETELHRYTTVIRSDCSMDIYFDGVKKFSVGAGSGPNPQMMLILQNALRQASALRGKVTFYVRSIAVYTDTPHAGKGYINGGIAPGTTVA